jgi:hypothetical protein
MLLADHLFQALRAHPIRQRLSCRRLGREKSVLSWFTPRHPKWNVPHRLRAAKVPIDDPVCSISMH